MELSLHLHGLQGLGWLFCLNSWLAHIPMEWITYSWPHFVATGSTYCSMILEVFSVMRPPITTFKKKQVLQHCSEPEDPFGDGARSHPDDDGSNSDSLTLRHIDSSRGQVVAVLRVHVQALVVDHQLLI